VSYANSFELNSIQQVLSCGLLRLCKAQGSRLKFYRSSCGRIIAQRTVRTFSQEEPGKAQKDEFMSVTVRGERETDREN
jgi:hypothetical protein